MIKFGILILIEQLNMLKTSTAETLRFSRRRFPTMHSMQLFWAQFDEKMTLLLPEEYLTKNVNFGPSSATNEVKIVGNVSWFMSKIKWTGMANQFVCL